VAGRYRPPDYDGNSTLAGRDEEANMAKDFESSLAELEQIVSEMETGDLPLQRALELFERGVQLSRNCQQQLDEAERKVELLIKGQDGQFSAVPFTFEND
jgi:exodeoxyribonuclease VII small subunit